MKSQARLYSFLRVFLLKRTKQVWVCSSASFFWSQLEEFPKSSPTFAFPPSSQRENCVILSLFHLFSCAHLCVGVAERPQPINYSEKNHFATVNRLKKIREAGLLLVLTFRNHFFEAAATCRIGCKQTPDCFANENRLSLSLRHEVEKKSDTCKAVSGCARACFVAVTIERENAAKLHFITAE